MEPLSLDEYERTTGLVDFVFEIKMYREQVGGSSMTKDLRSLQRQGQKMIELAVATGLPDRFLGPIADANRALTFGTFDGRLKADELLCQVVQSLHDSLKELSKVIP